uniref:Uncharacterized protein n=1 Tax=Hucho hucho TaxID=62062 RepID=A0A4W5KSY0_9TELE
MVQNAFPALGLLNQVHLPPTVQNEGIQGSVGGMTHASSPSLADFSSVPQFLVPPSSKNLSCTSQNSAADSEPLPLSYVTLQEQHWFLSWGTNVCTLFESLYTLQVKDSPPNIFECQLRLWTQWFESWSEKERNSFLHIQ